MTSNLCIPATPKSAGIYNCSTGKKTSSINLSNPGHSYMNYALDIFIDQTFTDKCMPLAEKNLIKAEVLSIIKNGFSTRKWAQLSSRTRLLLLKLTGDDNKTKLNNVPQNYPASKIRSFQKTFNQSWRQTIGVTNSRPRIIGEDGVIGANTIYAGLITALNIRRTSTKLDLPKNEKAKLRIIETLMTIKLLDRKRQLTDIDWNYFKTRIMKSLSAIRKTAHNQPISAMTRNPTNIAELTRIISEILSGLPPTATCNQEQKNRPTADDVIEELSSSNNPTNSSLAKLILEKFRSNKTLKNRVNDLQKAIKRNKETPANMAILKNHIKNMLEELYKASPSISEINNLFDKATAVGCSALGCSS